MRPIKSIIIFNSATAGDFLTALCWSQLFESSSLYEQQTTGRVMLKSSYFKKITQKIYHSNQHNVEFDYTKIYPVENSHYWLDCYLTMADHCVYINYPVELQQNIFDIYLEKVCNNNLQNMIDINLLNQHPYIASKMNVDNVQKIINIHWRKNVAAWQLNKNLTAIELEDFFDRSRLINIVETLIGQPISCIDKFNSIYHNWLAYNSKLRSLFV
jgi:hypothetical protein